MGSKLIISISEEGRQRQTIREINSGVSFGCSPLLAQIGLGKTEQVDSLSIIWDRSGKTQTFKDLDVNQWIRITEGEEGYEPIKMTPLKINATHARHLPA
ncbi:ASPIC/UnbV domain-containing protein [Catalinimonas niigatensis]|uniref:ASPIC/UnbV domain-containing protein n=1 Tax=Catalinimonas niigatensis TaxID=1397264 RepID=UPI0026654B54|nr:ASPIC/UnbV domain-containing protein [Catalinimonas niigatensis]WPP53653.1 ASPIC/UnbV domain-containing protein [Catalinimonas niigatensis]